MSELADINAKIDRLNRKLKADPIVMVHECDVLPVWQNEPVTLNGNTITMVCGSIRDAHRMLKRAAYTISQQESADKNLLLLARKIQLAILERLT